MTDYLSPRAVRRATRVMAIWIGVSTLGLYAAAVATDPPASRNTGPPPLSSDTTLSAVMLRPRLRVAAAVLLGLPLAALAALEPLRRLPLWQARSAAAWLALAAWVAVVLCPKNAPRNACPTLPGQEDTEHARRRWRQRVHWGAAGVFILSLAAWTWLHAHASGRGALRRIFQAMVVILVLLALLLLGLRRMQPGIALTTIRHMCAAAEAVEMVLYLLAVWLIGSPPHQSAATPGPGAAAAPWSGPL